MGGRYLGVHLGSRIHYAYAQTNFQEDFFVKLLSSVADPDPDPPDPHVFGPPGSGFTSQRGMDPDPDPSIIMHK
jgi:hypothetical protein